MKANMTQFQPGDVVFGLCRGSLAEYACARERRLVYPSLGQLRLEAKRAL